MKQEVLLDYSKAKTHKKSLYGKPSPANVKLGSPFRGKYTGGKKFQKLAIKHNVSHIYINIYYYNKYSF